MFNEPLHTSRKHMGSHLSLELREKYDWLRTIPVRKGDTVKVLRGSFKGHVGKVTNVDSRSGLISVEKATIAKVDGTQLAREMHPSNVIITKLDLSDPYRRRKIEKSRGED
jgi:large subunit ribosomal protein L24